MSINSAKDGRFVGELFMGWRIDENWIKPGTKPDQVMHGPGIAGPTIGSGQRIYGRNRIGKPKGLCTLENQGAKGTCLGGAGLLLQPLYLFVCVCRQVSVHNDRIAGAVINGPGNPLARAWAGPWGGLGHGFIDWCRSNNRG